MSGGDRTVSLIVAVSENGVIGAANELPWHLPADLRRFRSITLGHAIVMGRRTWESLGRPLPGRTNVVITRHPQAIAEDAGVIAARSLDDAIDRASAAVDRDEIFVIGGQAIFELALPSARRIYLTRVHACIEGDAFFPLEVLADFHRLRIEERDADESNRHALAFEVWERR